MGFKGGKRINELVSLINLPPTLFECAEIPIPKYMKGKPLQQLLTNNLQNWSNDVFIQISETQVGRAIRTHKWKYSVEAPEKDGILNSRSDIYNETFLYDLENDPHEKLNLIAEPEFFNVRKELSSILKQRMIEAGEDPPNIIIE